MFSSRWLRIGIHLWPFRFWLCFPFLKLDLVKVYAGDDWGFTLLSFGGEAKPRRALFKVTVWDRLVYLWLFWLPPLGIMCDPRFEATWWGLGDWGSGMGDPPADQPFQEDGIGEPAWKAMEAAARLAKERAWSIRPGDEAIAALADKPDEQTR